MVTREFKQVSVVGLTTKQGYDIAKKVPGSFYSPSKDTIRCRSVEMAIKVAELKHAIIRERFKELDALSKS